MLEFEYLKIILEFIVAVLGLANYSLPLATAGAIIGLYFTKK